MARLYDIFSGEQLEIAEKIQRRRYQMLVHSYIYYKLDKNIISDSQWSQWAVELAELQSAHPDIAEKVIYADDFAGWDGSSGAFLDFSNKPNIIVTANMLLQGHEPKPTVSVRKPLFAKPPVSKTPAARKKLF